MQRKQQGKIKSRLYIHRLLPIIAIIWWLSLSTNASACGCAPPQGGPSADNSVTASYKYSQIVFVAWVKAIITTQPATRTGPIPGPNGSSTSGVSGYDRHAARLSAEEVFKGVIDGEVLMPNDGTNCDFHFEAGRRYLIYASRNPDGSLTTHKCTRTAAFEDAQDDIAIIREFNAGKPRTRIFGLLGRTRFDLSGQYGKWTSLGPLAGQIIEAYGPAGTFQTTTDDAGRFRFVGIPVGEYRLMTLNVPLDVGRVNPNYARVTDTGFGNEVIIYAAMDAVIAGKVYTNDGQPVERNVTIFIAGVERKDGKLIQNGSTTAVTNDKSEYTFVGIPPGDYVVGINLVGPLNIQSPYPRMFYPHSSNLDKATIFTVKDQEHLNFDLHLFPKLPLKTYSGVVLESDDTPANVTIVELVEQRPDGNPSLPISVRSDGQGRFEITGFTDTEYWLRVAGNSELVNPPPPDGDGPIKVVLRITRPQPDRPPQKPFK